MSLYRRFVTYLFRYESGKKENGCGFAKMEVRQGSSRMELQIRSCADGNYKVYLFHAAKRGPVGVQIGELRVRGGNGREVFVFDGEPVGNSPYGLDRMSGIYMTAGGDGFVASQWDDETINWDVFHVYGSGQVRRDGEEDAEREEDEDGSTAETADELQEADDVAEIEYGRISEESEESPEDCDRIREKNGERPEESSVQPEVQVTQNAAAVNDASEPAAGNRSSVLYALPAGKLKGDFPAPVDVSPCMSAWEKQWKRFCALHPVLCPFDEAKDIYAVKMDLRDLRILPKRYHSLANNSFLLHGYFNYKYLLFGHMDGEEKHWFVAVPGVFQNQEQLLAGIFGFTEFRTKHVTKQRTGEFGFWYRLLDL